MSGMDRVITKKKWSPKKKFGLGLAVLVVAIGGYWVVQQTKGSQLKVNRDRLVISTVTKGPFQEYISILGEAQPRTTFFLDATEGGRVDKIFVEAGTLVHKGDPILRLSNTNLLLDVMFREAELFQQSNNLRNTRLLMEQQKLQLKKDMAAADYKLTDKRRSFERSKKLFEAKMISEEEYYKVKDEFEYLQKDRVLTQESMEQDLEFREQQVAQLELSLDRMKGNLDIIKEKLDRLTIKAPITGELTSLNAEFIGESKSPGERLGRINAMDGFKVRAQIDEHFITRIEPELKGTFNLSGEDYRLHVLKVFPEVREGRFEVDMTIEGTPPKDLRRGQTLHIKLALGDLTDAILLPRGGFFQTTGGNWAYVLDEQQAHARKKEIQLNRMNTEVFEVVSGLQPGDRVVTSSYETFAEKDQLNLN